MALLIIRQLLRKHIDLPNAYSNPLQTGIKPDLSLSSETAGLQSLNPLLAWPNAEQPGKGSGRRLRALPAGGAAVPGRSGRAGLGAAPASPAPSEGRGSTYLSHSEAVVKSVISNTSDSGCGDRAGEAVSGEGRGQRGRVGEEGESGRSRAELTSLSAAILRRCRTPPAAEAAGNVGEGGASSQPAPPSQPGVLSQCVSLRLLTARFPFTPRCSLTVRQARPCGAPASPGLSPSRLAAAPHGDSAGAVASHRSESPADSPAQSARVKKGSFRCSRLRQPESRRAPSDVPSPCQPAGG